MGFTTAQQEGIQCIVVERDAKQVFEILTFSLFLTFHMLEYLGFEDILGLKHGFQCCSLMYWLMK
jgi:hypothetical protein